MNTLELQRHVSELKRKKKRNEEKISKEDLNGKYKKAYGALCEDLKKSQADLKVKYLESMRKITEILSDSVFADPDTEAEEMKEKFLLADKELEQDPFYRKVMAAIFSFGDMEGEA